jgi:hypothetical protein
MKKNTLWTMIPWNSQKASHNCWFKESCDLNHSRTRFLFKLAIYKECDLPSSIFFYIFNRYKDQIEWKKKKPRRRRWKETALAIGYQSQLTPSPNYNWTFSNKFQKNSLFIMGIVSYNKHKSTYVPVTFI